MNYIDHNSLPIPIQSEHSIEVAISNPAVDKLKKMATCHDTPAGRKWVNSLTLATIVNSKPTNLRLAINQAGEAAVHAFLTSQFEYIAQTQKGFGEEKVINLSDCEALATMTIDTFGVILQPKDVILFTQAFRCGIIKTSGGKVYKMPELYGRLTQREIADGLHVYCKAKSQAVGEKRAELSKIADFYETKVSSLTESERQKLKVWATQNGQPALIAKIKLFERWQSGQLQADHKAEMDNLPPVVDNRMGAGQRLKQSLGIADNTTLRILQYTGN